MENEDAEWSCFYQCTCFWWGNINGDRAVRVQKLSGGSIAFFRTFKIESYAEFLTGCLTSLIRSMNKLQRFAPFLYAIRIKIVVFTQPIALWPLFKKCKWVSTTVFYHLAKAEIKSIVVEIVSLINDAERPEIVQSHVVVNLASKLGSLWLEYFAVEAPFLCSCCSSQNNY